MVSEMIDIRNRNLADVTRADDFIVSDKLISLMLAQISENKQLNAVFTDIFDPEGSEIYLKPANAYIETGKTGQFLYHPGSRGAIKSDRDRLPGEIGIKST